MAESKVRLIKSKGFTTLLNEPIRDKRLSLKTKGLYAVMASLPDDWEYSIAGLAVICNAGKDAIRSALKEMEAAGYLTRQQEHDDNGHFASCVYEIHDVSICPVEESGTPLSGFPSTVKPSSGKPSSGEPSSGNPTELNKEYINKRLNPPIVPQTVDDTLPKDKPEPKPRRRRRAKSEPSWQAERFEGFWGAYPRDEERAKAVEQWDAIPQDKALMDKHGGDETALLDEIARGLARHLACREWKEGVGIPHAWRWLRDRRWTEKQKHGGITDLGKLKPVSRRYHTEIVDGEEVVVYDNDPAS